MSRISDLKGKKFGRLTVLLDSGKRSNAGGMIWKCLCVCGRFTEVTGSNLKTGDIKSCGCLRQETTKRIKYKHGDARRNLRTRLHRIWMSMKNRCYNSKDMENYQYYGKKGIKICDDWRKNYLIFKKWALNSGYQENLVIDRINNNGNYEPNNCQWLTGSENSKKQWRDKKDRMIKEMIRL